MQRTPALDILLLASIASAAVLVHGYHLGADDAAIYVPAIKKVADPQLFPFYPEAFLRQAGLSLVPSLIGYSARLTRLPSDWAIFLWHVVSVFLLLLAARQLLRACFQNQRAQWAGVALLASLLTVPVAGTALVIMDPYVTARSLSTPAILFAIAAFAQNRVKPGLVWLVVTTLLHPQMGFYGAAFLGCLWMTSLSPGAATLALIPWSFEFGPAQGVYREVLASRSYFSVSNWAWYEWVGVAAPLLFFGWFSRIAPDGSPAVSGVAARGKNRGYSPAQAKTPAPPSGEAAAIPLTGRRPALQSGKATAENPRALQGNFGLVVQRQLNGLRRLWSRPWVCVEFCHGLRAGPVLLPPFRRVSRSLVVFGLVFTAAGIVLASSKRFDYALRLQPMRSFHLIYVVFFLFLGGLLGEYLLKNVAWRWCALFLPLAAAMWIVQAQAYPSSPHIEWPGAGYRSDWLSAFLWIRGNTPKDAVFALDPNYMALPEVDQHGFRAVAERSALADNLKDSGPVALFPDLADRWKEQVAAQEGWQNFKLEDYRRLSARYGVDWLVLRRSQVVTGLVCRYQNGAVSVCQIQR